MLSWPDTGGDAAQWAGALTAASPSLAWQGVERDLRSQISGNERGLVEEYVEKVPNPSLKSEWAGHTGGGAWRRRSLSSLKRGRGRKAHLLPVS